MTVDELYSYATDEDARMAMQMCRSLVMRAFEDIWNAKLKWVRGWTSLDSAILKSPAGILELKGGWMQVSLQGALNGYVGKSKDGYEGCSSVVAAFMCATSREVEHRLRF